MFTKTSLLLACAGLLSFAACSKATECPEPEVVQEDPVKRGEFLVSVGGCNDCHTPKIMTDKGPAMDMSRMLSGHPANEQLAPYDKSMVGPWALMYPGLTAAVGPWGTSFSANLTPSESGIGSWTEEQFVKALTEGKHMGMDNSRPIMPPMPWQEMAKWDVNDIKAIYAYLKSIPPIDNVVPAYMPPVQ